MHRPRPSTEPRGTRIWRRVFELALEVSIAVALVIGIVLYAIYGPKESRIDAKWFAFAANTVFVFGYTLKVVRPLWTKPKLWAVFTGLLLLHGIIGWAVISRVERIPLVWYVPVDMAEILGGTDRYTVGLPCAPSADTINLT